jgi:hypothetical protein
MAAAPEMYEFLYSLYNQALEIGDNTLTHEQLETLCRILNKADGEEGPQ